MRQHRQRPAVPIKRPSRGILNHKRNRKSTTRNRNSKYTFTSVRNIHHHPQQRRRWRRQFQLHRIAAPSAVSTPRRRQPSRSLLLTRETSSA
jgi:transposase-like protein